MYNFLDYFCVEKCLFSDTNFHFHWLYLISRLNGNPFIHTESNVAVHALPKPYPLSLTESICSSPRVCMRCPYPAGVPASPRSSSPARGWRSGKRRQRCHPDRRSSHRCRWSCSPCPRTPLHPSGIERWTRDTFKTTTNYYNQCLLYKNDNKIFLRINLF